MIIIHNCLDIGIVRIIYVYDVNIGMIESRNSAEACGLFLSNRIFSQY